MNRNSAFLILCAVAGLGVPVATGCSRPAPGGSKQPGRPPVGASDGALALVNGQPITEADLQAEMHAKPGSPALTSDQKKAFLERVIGRELVAQKAAEMALGDAPYRQELARRTAELNAWKRRVLADAYFDRASKADLQVTEDDARRYFDDHAAEVRAEVNVRQILARDEGQIERARQLLEAGKPFEEVARDRYGTLPEGQKPWDLGWMKWMQIPAPWRAVLPKLKPGDTSDVVRGSGGRFWILQLVDRRVDENLGFDQARGAILEDLKAARMEEARTRIPEELRKAARVEYPASAGPAD